VRVLVPSSVADACGMLAGESPTPPAAEGVIPIAGGTDLLVHWPQRLDLHERTFLDLSVLSELRGIRWSDRALELGALSTYWDAIRDPRVGAEFPLLVRAARQIGAIQIQSRGTWAGNIVNASPAADGVPVLMAYDATVVLTGRDGVTEVALSDFYTGYKQMRRRPDQLVTAVRLPRRVYDVQVFEKVGARRAQAIAKVGLAITRSAEGWRIVAASVAPTIRRCPALEALVQSGAKLPDAGALLTALDRDVAPIDDIRSTARYRRETLARLLFHAFKPVCPSFGGPGGAASE
jgi:CO/xanthine dehydrogenase FAD-binding subunit